MTYQKRVSVKYDTVSFVLLFTHLESPHVRTDTMQLPVSVPHDILVSQMLQQITHVNVLIHNTIEQVKLYQGFEPKELNEAFHLLCQSHQVIMRYSGAAFCVFSFFVTRITHASRRQQGKAVEGRFS